MPLISRDEPFVANGEPRASFRCLNVWEPVTNLVLDPLYTVKGKNMKTKYVCQRCGLGVGQWAKGTGTIWKHHGNWHSTSCGKPPRVVERAVHERDMTEFVNGAFDALEAMKTSPEPEKKPCPKCQGFGYLDGPDDPECDLCEGDGMATVQAISRFQ